MGKLEQRAVRDVRSRHENLQVLLLMGQQLNDHEIDEPRRRRIVIVVLENDVFNVR